MTRTDVADDYDSIDLAVVDVLADLTGQQVSIAWAAQVRQQILGGRLVKSRAVYVLKAIEERPNDFLPQVEPARPSLRSVPPWCGFCNADDYRWIETAGGRWAKCQECNPDAAKEAS